MARKLRVEYAGAIYHVMNRGDRRERIFIRAAASLQDRGMATPDDALETLFWYFAEPGRAETGQRGGNLHLDDPESPHTAGLALGYHGWGIGIRPP